MNNVVKIDRKKKIADSLRHIESFLELTPNFVSFPLNLTPSQPSIGLVDTYTLESLLAAFDEIESQISRGDL